MKSALFTPEIRGFIETTVVRLLNDNQLMNDNTVNSPRAVGDAVQEFLGRNISRCLPRKLVANIDTSFARRSMADFAFEDTSGNLYFVDIKTHNLDTDFSRPNLTSVERLAEFYSENKNYFVILMVPYRIDGKRLLFDNCIFAPIEYFDCSCLTLGALGWGQIQIANSNVIIINAGNTRKEWMLQLCDALDYFYRNEKAKIMQRINYFNDIKEYWKNQPE